MKSLKNIFLLLFIAHVSLVFGQKKTANRQLQRTNPVSHDSIITKSKRSEKKLSSIEDYKYFNTRIDTFNVDTSLTIKKNYKFNYLRRDYFGLIPFSNIGQTYNTLSHDFNYNSPNPSFGSRARHFNYMEIEDVNYYHVPTPFTELQYKTAFEQGQLLDAFFTVNTSKQLNFSVAYKGLRSLGKYQNILTSSGNFRVTTNYITKNKKYNSKAHIVTQDLLNQENGGLTLEGIENFESGSEDFLDRSVFDPNFQNAENKLVGKRFYINHEYDFGTKSDSLNSKGFKLRNITVFEDKFFSFDQTSASNDFFGESFSNQIRDKTTLEDFNSSLEVLYNLDRIGNISFGANYNNFNYGYDQIVVLNESIIPNRLKGNNVSLIGSLNSEFGKFRLDGGFKLNVSGDFDGYSLDASVQYAIDENNIVNGLLKSYSRLPNYNTLLYQSDYLDYNWNNSSLFDNVESNQIAFKLKSKKIANIDVDFTTTKNYTYFSNDEGSTSNIGVMAYQFDGNVNYFRVQINKEIRYGKFALDNTFLYQNVVEGDKVLNTPDFITRNTLYFSDHLFKRALFLQTGITFNYFSEYNMDAYNPLLAEFFVQNEQTLGGFPRLDFFINAKVRQTRIYLKAEHFNSAWTGYNYYSAPNNPYRDFTVRFGLVWNFFL